MKLALVCQPFDGILPPNQNSIGLIAYHTAIELSRNAGITLYGKQRKGQAIPAGLPFVPSFVPGGFDDILRHVTTRYPRWAGRFGIGAMADAHSGYVRSIIRRLDGADHDLIHVMNYWSWCRRLKGRRTGRRVVLEMQSEWLSQMDPHQVARELESVDAVVTVSDHIARLFRASFPAYRGVVATAYNGVNVDDFRPANGQGARADEPPPVLFVGRVSPEKGIHTLVEAFAQVVSRVENARLAIVGPRSTMREDFLVGISSDPLVRALSRFYDGSVCSDYQRYLDDLVDKLGLRGKVSLPGPVPHRELVDRYRSCSVVVNPSLSESFGISIVEGMACAVPVVGTKVGGMLETVVDGQTGLLVEPERPDQLADAMVSLLADRETRVRLGANGRARAVEHFSWRARAERLLSTYRKVLGPGRG